MDMILGKTSDPLCEEGTEIQEIYEEKKYQFNASFIPLIAVLRNVIQPRLFAYDEVKLNEYKQIIYQFEIDVLGL
jgi:hypothetical protein